VIGANASFPQNDLVGAYVILTSLAMATQPTFCMSTAPGACPYLEGAQAQASAMFARGATDPGFLHYGLHAHDYPYEAVYSSGLPFAVSCTPHKPSNGCLRRGKSEARRLSDLLYAVLPPSRSVRI
jgi:hypothetical protein